MIQFDSLIHCEVLSVATRSASEWERLDGTLARSAEKVTLHVMCDGDDSPTALAVWKSDFAAVREMKRGDWYWIVVKPYVAGGYKLNEPGTVEPRFAGLQRSPEMAGVNGLVSVGSAEETY